MLAGEHNPEIGQAIAVHIALQDPAAVAPFVAAVAHAQAVPANVGRSKPFAEMSYLDAQGQPVATAIFSDAQGPALLATRTAGT